MKKLFLGSIVLMIFSISIILFQISCQKTVTGQTNGNNYTLPPASTSTLGGIIVGQGLSVTENGTLSVNNTSAVIQLNKIIYARTKNSITEIWTANYDGSNKTKLNITFPSNLYINQEIKISPDGQTVFFQAENNAGTEFIYSCKIDGSNLTQIVDGSTADSKGITFGQAY